MRRIIFSGTGITTAVSLVFAVALASATSTDVQIAFLIGLLTSLIGLTITALFAFEQRLEQIDRARIGALRLHRLLSVPEIEPTTARLVDAAADTNAEHRPFMQSMVRETVEAACGRVCGIKEGSVQCDRKDEVRLVSRALEYTRSSVIAVAARGPDWWTRPEADVYWGVYGQAAQRLDITRIFVLRDESAEQMERVLRRHYEGGMKTYTVKAADVPPDRLQPVVVFDGNLLHRHAPRHEGDEGYRIEFSDKREDIISAEANFKVLLGFAEEWRPDDERAAAASPREEGVPRGAAGGLWARLIRRADRGSHA